MNIRTVTNPLTSIESPRPAEARTVKTEVSSEDRDANGQRHEKEPDKNPLNEEEMKKAEEYIQGLPGFTTNGLKLEVGMAGDHRIFLIIDQSGQVVRRILDWEMRVLIEGKDKKTGQIFDKSA